MFRLIVHDSMKLLISLVDSGGLVLFWFYTEHCHTWQHRMGVWRLLNQISQSAFLLPRWGLVGSHPPVRRVFSTKEITRRTLSVKEIRTRRRNALEVASRNGAYA